MSNEARQAIDDKVAELERKRLEELKKQQRKEAMEQQKVRMDEYDAYLDELATEYEQRLEEFGEDDPAVAMYEIVMDVALQVQATMKGLMGITTVMTLFDTSISFMNEFREGLLKPGEQTQRQNFIKRYFARRKRAREFKRAITDKVNDFIEGYQEQIDTLMLFKNKLTPTLNKLSRRMRGKNSDRVGRSETVDKYLNARKKKKNGDAGAAGEAPKAAGAPAAAPSANDGHSGASTEGMG